MKSEQVVAFIDTIAQGADPTKLTVVVLDNARFHTSKKIKEKQPQWEQKGVLLRFLPPYCPHLNPTEALWKQLKSFLLPRRHYDSLTSLKQAVFEALDLLGAICVKSSVGGAYTELHSLLIPTEGVRAYRHGRARIRLQNEFVQPHISSQPQ